MCWVGLFRCQSKEQTKSLTSYRVFEQIQIEPLIFDTQVSLDTRVSGPYPPRVHHDSCAQVARVLELDLHPCTGLLSTKHSLPQ